MAKTTERLTKAKVREEVVNLRQVIINLNNMTDYQLSVEFYYNFPNASEPLPTRQEMTTSLIISATYHLTNVLNLE